MASTSPQVSAVSARRTLGALAAVAVVAVIGAGCSNGNHTTSGASSGTSTNREQATKFSQCMRDDGVTEFPDPDASGALTIEDVANGTAVNTNTAAFKQALASCKDLEPAGFTGSKRTPEQQQAALEFAACIRDNGVKDFPDPAIDDPLIDTTKIPSTDTPGGMTILHAAMQKCHDHAAAAGVTGGK